MKHVFPHRRDVLLGLAGGLCALKLAPARAQSGIELKPDLADVFRDARTEGTFAAFVKDHMVMTDESRARIGFIPASTFKIPHALIALETGVVADVDKEVIRWDGVPNEIEEWNRDHTLRSAMQYSVVPVFQQIAKRIGSERMKKFVDDFDYGNRDIGGAPLDRFWLDGNLRITALEQVRFLRRFYREDLPVSKRNLELVKDIIPEEKVEDIEIHAKTGTQFKDGKPFLGWLVGWGERGDEATIFAMNIDVHSAAHLAQRWAMSRAILKRIWAAG